MSHPPQSLQILDGVFAVCRLSATAAIPPWAITGEFFAITRTADELSIVCREALAPAGVQCERGWRGLRVAGSMDFSVVGVLAALVGPLAEAGISIFAFSTFDTDYLLVREPDFTKAISALQAHGHTVQ